MGFGNGEVDGQIDVVEDEAALRLLPGYSGCQGQRER